MLKRRFEGPPSVEASEALLPFSVGNMLKTDGVRPISWIGHRQCQTGAQQKPLGRCICAFEQARVS